ncbi:hypothetical protein CMI47_10400 [Candidatus Pacearchaeota archaeon]|nr:hypothetical protein [Candidatus Pacearchaeota archaeon]
MAECTGTGYAMGCWTYDSWGVPDTSTSYCYDGKCYSEEDYNNLDLYGSTGTYGGTGTRTTARDVASAIGGTSIGPGQQLSDGESVSAVFYIPNMDYLADSGYYIKPAFKGTTDLDKADNLEDGDMSIAFDKWEEDGTTYNSYYTAETSGAPEITINEELYRLDTSAFQEYVYEVIENYETMTEEEAMTIYLTIQAMNELEEATVMNYEEELEIWNEFLSTQIDIVNQIISEHQGEIDTVLFPVINLGEILIHFANEYYGSEVYALVDIFWSAGAYTQYQSYQGVPF